MGGRSRNERGAVKHQNVYMDIVRVITAER
jgi:hypothetical protein